MSTPSISVIIPVFNAAPFLRECLDSLLNQSFNDFEAVCVNDGSEDNSLEILEEYAKTDARIRIISQPNGGYGKAMNAGMAKATGTYMAILEPDDCLPPNAYEVLYSLSENGEIDIVKGQYASFVGMDDKRLYTPELFELPESLQNPLTDPFVFTLPMVTCTAIYRMAYLHRFQVRYNESPGASYQDNGFHFLSLAFAESVRYTRSIVYHYRKDNAASSIHNQGKVYAIQGEYAYIRQFMENYPERWEAVKSAYVYRRVITGNYTYHRIAHRFRAEYLESWRKELVDMCNRGYDFSMCPRSELIMAESIMESPIAFTIVNQLTKKFSSLHSPVRGDSKPTEAFPCTDRIRICKLFGIPMLKIITCKHAQKIYFLGLQVIQIR